MKQELLNELNAIEGDIVFINCINMGTVPHIVRGPRFNVPLKKTQVASLITMGYKIEIVSPKKEVPVEDIKLSELVQEVSVIKLDGSKESFNTTLETKLDIPEEARVAIVETIPEILENINTILEEKKEDELVEEVPIDNNLEGMSKTKLKKLLKEHNIEFENSDSIEVLKEKASAII
jgi:hypothetical protein